MTTEYIAYPWPEYQEYMGKEWFRKECYYCADKDVYFIPKNRVNTTSIDSGLGIMKKLTIEEKAKAYDKVIEKLRDFYRDYDTISHLIDVKEELANLFPELKESEDKEIRKDIIRNLKRYINCIKDGYDTHSAKTFVVNEIEKQIAWLEKQGQELKKVSIWKHWKNGIAGNGDGKLIYLIKMGNTYKLTSCLGVECDYIELSELDNLMFEKQGEQKPANSYCQENCKGFQETGKCFADGDCKAKREAESNNKFKPKFKVGDWISNDMCDVHIASIEDGMYYFDEGDGLSIVFVDEHYHLWTIEDAIDGDILAFNNETIVIFKDLYNKTSFHSYCHIEDGIFTVSEKNIPDWWEGKGFYPATKEQRDLLFQKMKEAGYVWDSEKKELRKVEQNPTAWSDEDEPNIQNIDSVLFYDRKLPEDTCVKLRNFLKTLKQRIGWKPSEEQISSLRDVIYSLPHQPVLFTLYNDLKKLKGE